jgi:hypothetical protein
MDFLATTSISGTLMPRVRDADFTNYMKPATKESRKDLSSCHTNATIVFKPRGMLVVKRLLPKYIKNNLTDRRHCQQDR